MNNPDEPIRGTCVKAAILISPRMFFYPFIVLSTDLAQARVRVLATKTLDN